MTTLTLGWRRLYDALGFSTAESQPIVASVTLHSGKQLNFYLGGDPPIGVMTINEGGYLIPGHQATILQTNTEYKTDCFCEISISWKKEISIDQASKLATGSNEFHQEILEEINKSLSEPEIIMDAVAGILGLAIHRQLVLKPLIEHAYFTGGPNPVSSFIGPVWENLDRLGANQESHSHILNLLKGMEATPEKALLRGGATLHWLLKAWRERDYITRFMYLFIPLEAIVQSTAELNQTSLSGLMAIRSIVEASDSANKIDLLNFIDRAKTKFNPSLNTRFEELAKKHALPGWELDVEAFKKFNRMRNLLLHTGNKRLSTHINFEEHARALEDLVERYISLELVGNPNVYQTSHRPRR